MNINYMLYLEIIVNRSYTDSLIKHSIKISTKYRLITIVINDSKLRIFGLRALVSIDFFN